MGRPRRWRGEGYPGDGFCGYPPGDGSGFFATIEEAQPVEYDEERRAHIGSDGHPEGGESEHGEDDEDDFESQREDDVLFDDVERSAGMSDEPREFGQVVGHEGDVGSLDGGV